MLATIGLQVGLSKSDKDKTTQEYLAESSKLDKLHYVWETRLIALGLMLKSLNETHNLDLSAFLTFADAKNIYGFEHEVDMLDFLALIDNVAAAPEVAAYFNMEASNT